MNAKVFINKPEYYDKLLETLLDDDLKTKDYKQIKDRILHDFGGHIILVNQIDELSPEITLYRITDFIPPNGEEHLIKHYSYNPNPSIGRANLPGYPVFYGSFSPGTCISEMKVLKDCTYYISKWKLLPKDGFYMASLIMGIEQELEYSSTIMSKASEKAFSSLHFESEVHRQWFKYKHKSFCDLFTIKDSSAYHLSSAIAHDYLYDSRTQGVDIPILAYPSITNDFKDVNLAIRAELTDNADFFRMESILKCELVEKNDQGYTIKVSEKGLTENNRVKWFSLHYQFVKIDTDEIAIKPIGNDSFIKISIGQKVQVECGEYIGDLRDFVKGHYSNLIRRIIEEGFEDDLSNLDFFSKSNTFPKSKLVIADLLPGLNYINIHGKKQIEKIQVKVDFNYVFTQNNL